MDEKELKALIEEQNRLIKQLREKVESGEKSGKNMMKESTESIEALNKRLDGIEFDEMKKNDEALNARLDDIEVKLLRPMQATMEKQASASEAERKAEAVLNAYNKWVRKGEKSLDTEELKALAVDTETQGGYMVPVQRSRDLIKKLIEFSPMRELAGVVRISSGDMYEEPSEGAQDFAANWVGERAARSETQSAKLGLEKIPVHEMYANPFVTQKMLDDPEFDVEGWLNERLSMRFSVLEGTAFISGTGVNMPEGVLTHAGIPTVNSGSSGALTADGLINLVYDLPEYYVRNSTFLTKRSSLGAIRKLKDSQNQYLWQPGLSGGQPATILDRPYREAIDMPVVAAASKSIVFGDFSRGYRIVDRIDVRQLRDPYSNKPYVSFYTTRRVGGQVILPEALRIQVCS